MKKMIILNNFNTLVEEKSPASGYSGFSKMYIPYDDRYIVKYGSTDGCCPHCGRIQCYNPDCKSEKLEYEEVLEEVSYFIANHEHDRHGRSWIELGDRTIWSSSWNKEKR